MEMTSEKRVFIVQFPYDAQLSDELSVRPGDNVEVDKWDAVEEHWTCGKLLSTGQRGKLYKGFLNRTKEKEDETELSSPSTSELQQDWVFSSSSRTAAYNGRQYMLEETPQDWLQCIVCRELACSPQQTLCCGQMLCYECTEQWGKCSNSCPHCQSDPFEVVTDPRSERYIAGLTCLCPNISNGCKWRGSLKKVEMHVKLECLCESVQCANCDKVMQRKNIPDHNENECEWREVTCPCCGSVNSPIAMTDVGEALSSDSADATARMTFHDLVSRHYKECPQWPARCPNSDSCNAGFSFTRITLVEHLNESCPHAMVECQFADMGCESTVLRKDLPQHLNESLVTHMQLLFSDYSRVKVSVSELTTKIKKLQRKNRNLKSLVYWHMPERKSRKPQSLYSSQIPYS